MIYTGTNAQNLTRLAAPTGIRAERGDIARAGVRSVGGRLIFSPRRLVRTLTLSWRPVGAETLNEIVSRLTAGSFIMKYTDPESEEETQGEFVCERYRAELLQPGKYEVVVRLIEI